MGLLLEGGGPKGANDETIFGNCRLHLRSRPGDVRTVQGVRRRLLGRLWLRLLCCVTYCYGAVRGGYAYPRYGSRRYGYGHRYSRYGYPRARGYARRQLRREAIRDW